MIIWERMIASIAVMFAGLFVGIYSMKKWYPNEAKGIPVFLIGVFILGIGYIGFEQSFTTFDASVHQCTEWKCPDKIEGLGLYFVERPMEVNDYTCGYFYDYKKNTADTVKFEPTECVSWTPKTETQLELEGCVNKKEVWKSATTTFNCQGEMYTFTSTTTLPDTKHSIRPVYDGEFCEVVNTTFVGKETICVGAVPK